MYRVFKHWVFNQHRKYVWFLSRIGRKVNTDMPIGQNELYIVTVAYNHVRLIEKQIELVKRYVTDKNYLHIIVDNSPSKKARKLIKEVCDREHVGYISIPRFVDMLICHKIFGNGISHGAALNWMFYYFLKQRKPVRFALIDHDVFPMEDYSFIEKLGERDFYGVERIKEHGWYLWPGWCIFRYDAISDCKPNFLPYYLKESYFDSGGGNYPRFYGRYDLNNVEFPPVVTRRIRHTKELTAYNDIYHGDCVQLIDGYWLHFINGSNCAKIPGKEQLVNKILDNIESLYLKMKKE
jgi:hypothetical protein